MKKDILIACQPLDVGGVTRSLLSLLYCIDYEKYNIDLILMRNSGEFLDTIPDEVNLLEPALNEKNYYLAKLKKFFLYTVKGYFIYNFFYKRTIGRKYKNSDFQLMAGLARCTAARKLKKKYDIAIGYIEGFENAYIVKKVNAEKKIGYIHVDYENAGLDPRFDRKIFESLDNIVLISNENRQSFNRVFPQFAKKSRVVENIICRNLINSLANEKIQDFEIDKDYFNIVTAARLVIKHKGLDRAVKALARLKKAGYNVRWYVFGEGADRNILENMIEEYGVRNDFILMGERKNVYPYIEKCDVFAMPSRYEGKPIAVSEAQVLGIVPIVTQYLSAEEQINNNIDGLILENTDEAIYYGLKRVLDDRDFLQKMKDNLAVKNDDFYTGLRQFYDLLENDNKLADKGRIAEKVL